eukprot:scaffold55315_cov29-Tisochrysis_lutea.AAC.2
MRRLKVCTAPCFTRRLRRRFLRAAQVTSKAAHIDCVRSVVRRVNAPVREGLGQQEVLVLLE